MAYDWDYALEHPQLVSTEFLPKPDMEDCSQSGFSHSRCEFRANAKHAAATPVGCCDNTRILQTPKTPCPLGIVT